MADQNKEIFVLDTGSMVAKLHLGGCQTYPKVSFFNSGIIDMEAGATPDKPGKVSFDFTNKAGQFELAACDGVYEAPLVHSQEDIEKELNSLKEEAGATDDPKDIEEKIKAKREEMNQANADSVAKYDESHLKIHAKYLKSYVIWFAGKDKGAKVKELDLVKFNLPTKMADPGAIKKYDGYKVPEMDEKEKKKIAEEQAKDKKAKVVKLTTVAYKIGFNLDSD